MINNYGMNTIGSVTPNFDYTWMIISVVIAIIGGILAYFMFVKTDEEPTDKNLSCLKDFLNFKKMIIEDLLKISYLVASIFVTIGSLSYIRVGFLNFLLFLLLGNLFIRIIYEIVMILISIWHNINEINNKLVKVEKAKEPKKRETKKVVKEEVKTEQEVEEEK